MTGRPTDSLIHVAAAVIERDGRYLLTKRRQGTHMAGHWEFPGGKLEPGESPAEALSREILEELGIEIDAPTPLTVIDHDYPERRVRLSFFDAGIRAGRPEARDVADFGWFSPDEMPGLPILPADLPLVELLARRAHGSTSP